MARTPSSIGGRRRRPRIASAAALILALPSAAWLAAPLHWVIDLVGNLSAQLLLVVLAATIWWTLRRYRAAAVVGWVSVCLLVWPLATGRAPRAGSDDAPAIRVLVYNPLLRPRPAEDEIRLVRESGADLVALVEPPERMIQATASGGELRHAYPHMVFRPWGWDPLNAYHILLSRWPLTRPDGRPLDEPFTGVVEAVADTPRGRIGLVVLQPRSPRTAERWHQGLEEADRAAAAARRLAAAGLPVIVMGDLNSTPSGLLSRRLCSRAGLHRCKPWLAPHGTFPSKWAWPLRVAIDDVLVSHGLAVSSWETLPPAGSDHLPVLVGLTVPLRPTTGR